jgi:hypothetical protein
MDAQALLQEFIGSQAGQDAAAALSAQGLSADQVSQALEHGVTAAHAHVQEQGAGMLGDHMGRNIFAAFAGGLLKGDGLFGSIKDGLEGGVTGRLAEALSSKMGLPPSTISGVTAAMTPFLTSFIGKKLGG